MNHKQIARRALAGSYNPNLSGGDVWAALGAIGMGASAYHGYKRNEQAGNPVAWALWWGFWGALLPIITVPVALAQGFAKPLPPATTTANNTVPEGTSAYGYLPLR